MSQQQYSEVYSANPAENYERYFVPAIGAPAAERLVEVAALRPGERVLDVACGTGVVARRAASMVGTTGSVTGIDINPGMLAVARSVAPSDARIEWHEASAEAMPLPDESFDVVLCQMGLQFIADKDAALSEMRRVLAPGGRLVLNVPGPTPPPFVKMAESLAKYAGPEAAGFVNQAFSLHDTADLRDLISNAGFRDVAAKASTATASLPSPAAFFQRYVNGTPLAGMVAQLDNERRSALERDVVAKWQEFVKDGGMSLQVRIVVATARK